MIVLELDHTRANIPFVDYDTDLESPVSYISKYFSLISDDHSHFVCEKILYLRLIEIFIIKNKQLIGLEIVSNRSKISSHLH